MLKRLKWFWKSFLTWHGFQDPGYFYGSGYKGVVVVVYIFVAAADVVVVAVVYGKAAVWNFCGLIKSFDHASAISFQPPQISFKICFNVSTSWSSLELQKSGAFVDDSELNHTVKELWGSVDSPKHETASMMERLISKLKNFGSLVHVPNHTSGKDWLGYLNIALEHEFTYQ